MDSGLIFPHHGRRSKASGLWLEGRRRAGYAVPQGRGHLRSRSVPKDRQEKPTPDKSRDRTKTDTGRRDEDSKALERTLVKELGKLAP
jgi:hypothetical protein